MMDFLILAVCIYCDTYNQVLGLVTLNVKYMLVSASQASLCHSVYLKVGKF